LFGHLLLEVLAWLYLATGASLAVWLLLERRGARYLYGAWLLALGLLLATLPQVTGRLGLVGGLLCAVLVGLLVRAADWTTRAHAA